MKTKRKIIHIDEQLCNGCGICIKGCHEGALQLIDHKARIISELYCDGLGACIGDCPTGAITIEEREAQPYDEVAVMARIALQGEETILAHLRHLKEHGENQYLQLGIDYLKHNDIPVNLTALETKTQTKSSGCAGSKMQVFATPNLPGMNARKIERNPGATSALTHWPVQLHLLNPEAAIFQKADVLLAADCTAFAYADFHNRFLANHKLAIACPKLDGNQEIYVSKLVRMFENSRIASLTVLIMEVPCCGGLFKLVLKAMELSERKVPLKKIVIGTHGDIRQEETYL